MSLLAGKTVVVSGVGAGLGHQIAATVVRDGGNAVLGARTKEQLEQLVRETGGGPRTSTAWPWPRR